MSIKWVLGVRYVYMLGGSWVSVGWVLVVRYVHMLGVSWVGGGCS